MYCHVAAHTSHQQPKVKTLQGNEKKWYHGQVQSEEVELSDSYHSCRRDGRLSNSSKITQELAYGEAFKQLKDFPYDFDLLYQLSFVSVPIWCKCLL